MLMVVGLAWMAALSIAAIAGVVALSFGLVLVTFRAFRLGGMAIVLACLAGASVGAAVPAVLALLIEHSLRYLDTESWLLWIAAGAGVAGFPVFLVVSVILLIRRHLHRPISSVV